MEKENFIFDRLPAKFCGMVEEYRLRLAEKNWLDMQLDVSLAWTTICWIHETVLISKKFWFIKRLVDNDKIFLWDIALKVYNLDLRAGKHTYTEYPIYESLLMLLSISDTPIDDLVSYLKNV